jgi:hypothetical protein
MANVADSAEALVGVNVMVTWQLAFTANVVTQLLTWLNSDELAGATDEITSGLLPLLVMVTGI